MKSFRWLLRPAERDGALDGHRRVAAEREKTGLTFDLCRYQDDTLEIVYLGSGANEDQLEKLGDQFFRKARNPTQRKC